MGCKARWGAMHNVADMVRFEIIMVLQTGIACVLREVLVWYEMCDMVRNGGVTWNVVWFSVWNDSCNIKGGGVTCDEVRDLMAMCFTFRGPHLTGHHHITSNHISGTLHHTTFHYHQITYHMAWCGILCCGIWRDVECFAMPDVPYSS